MATVRRIAPLRTVLLGVATLAAIVVARSRSTQSLPAPPRLGPFQSAIFPAGDHQASDSEYAGSTACRECHPSEYESWQHSFHSSMTQVPTASTVLAPWDGVNLELEGFRYQLFARRDELWLRLPDPAIRAALERSMAAGSKAVAAEIPRVERQLLLTTGSHHYQAYWVGGGRGNELFQVPFVYHLRRREFLPRSGVFLQPSTDPPHTPRWNSSCIQCHAVAGQPQHDQRSDAFATRVAELGIACEACHGPAGAHAAHYSQWWPRLGSPLAEDQDVVDPGKLGAAAASEVCGQCHAYFVPNHPEQWWQNGFAGHSPPRSPLREKRQLLDLPQDRDPIDWSIDAAWQSIFFADGTVRVGGREYNGLIKSKCYVDGQSERKLGCLNCHSMHGDSPVGQLQHAATSDEACLQCHQPQARYGSNHTKHEGQSSGSRCVNCHMPRTAYALLRSIRSHRITRPSADRTREFGVPNACNLCHLDRSLAWTKDRLELWNTASRQTKRTAIDSGPPQIVLEALSAEAGVRALAVAALANPLVDSSPVPALRPIVLATALQDPYAAIRFIAWQGLENLDLTRGLTFDYSLDPEEHSVARLRSHITRRASKPPAPLGFGSLSQSPRNKKPPLPHPKRQPEPETLPWWLKETYLAELTANRDDQPIRISE